MNTGTKRALPEYEQNPQLHLKKLYEFKVKVMKHYTGEDQTLLLDGVNTKIAEIKNKIEAQRQRDEYNNS